MKKRILIILLLTFCWLTAETGSWAVNGETVLKPECGIQIKNFSNETVDI